MMNMKTVASVAFIPVLLMASFVIGTVASAAAPDWDVSGNYEVAVNYLGSDYVHDMTLAQDAAGDLTGSGGYPAGGPATYTWVVASGTVDGSAVELHAYYTAPAEATTPLTVMHMTGVVALDGTMSGTWSDNYAGGTRAGTWTTTEGTASELVATLAAEDFGVVDYDTGLGQLAGYTAGFGLTDATFENVQSVVVKLYAGTTLLQTNTATAQVGTDIVGAQISTPFDVSGTFDYDADGYWTNVREAEYGQTLAATRVVVTVTLESGQVVTAENTNLTGDPSTIFPPVVEDPLTNMGQCKNGGWMDFGFKNQGKCIADVMSHGKSSH